MSSILDALKKLEAEKAAKQTEPETPEEHFEAGRAEEVLTAAPRESGLHLSPAHLVAGGLLFAVLLIAVSVTVSVVLTRNATSPSPPLIAAAPVPAPAPVTIPPQPPAETPPPPPPAQPVMAEPVAPPAPAPALTPPPPPPPAPTAPVAVVSPAPALKAEPAPTPEPPDPAPAPAPAPEPPTPAPTPAPPAPTPPAPPAPVTLARTAPPAAVNLRELPVLRSSDRARFGLENLKLNVLREASDNRPHGLAIINLNKVYIGEIIPGTRARLIEVKSHGIGLEIVDTGERFYVQH